MKYLVEKIKKKKLMTIYGVQTLIGSSYISFVRYTLSRQIISI